MIAVVVITWNRVSLLRKCVENVLLRTSTDTTEIVIWDNASTDGTRDYLLGVTDPRLRILASTTNVGMNGYAHAIAATTAPFVVDLDDDVVDAPPNWDRTLLTSYRRLADVGFLAADLVDDPYDIAAEYRYRIRPHEYRLVERNGVELLEGPAGGGCAMTERVLIDEAGGFRERPGEVFWLEDEEYVAALANIGYRSAVLPSVKVHHTGGPHYTQPSPAKDRYWSRIARRRARRSAIKRALLAIPFVPALNKRFGWFQAPEPRSPSA